MKIKPSLSRVKSYDRPPFSRKGFIRLDMNENNFGCAPEVIRSLKKLRPEDLAMYPEYSIVRKKLAVRHRLRPENICITAGGDQAIRAVMEAFVERGSQVIIPNPTFSIYPLYAFLQQAMTVPVPYGPGFSFPLQEVLRRIGAATKLAVVVSPNNPTGTAISRDGLEMILKKMPAGLVLLDHTYCLFGGGDFSSLVRRFPNLVVLHSFSKTFGLAGLRLGYLLASPETIENIEKVLPPFSVNSLALVAAEKALAAIQYTKQTLMRIRKEKRFLIRELGRMGIAVHPSQASFFLADFGAECSRIMERLFEERILLKGFPGDIRLKGLVRITVGRPEQNRILLKNLEKIINNTDPG